MKNIIAYKICNLLHVYILNSILPFNPKSYRYVILVIYNFDCSVTYALVTYDV